MISIDFQCTNKHRFEGYFKDYLTFREQLDMRMISCPVCETSEVKRIYTGCSIHARSSHKSLPDTSGPNMFHQLREITRFVKDNFENVGCDFYETARAIHYGVEEGRAVYGNTTVDEARELLDEGVPIVPLVDIEHLEN